MKTAKELQDENFICTDADTNQWVKKISDNRFLVYEKERLFDIDLSDYTEEELEEEVSAYYNSLEVIYLLYGDNSNQIIAECIAESDIF